MNIFYIKLKTGEDLLGVYHPSETETGNVVMVEGLITFDPDPETGTTLARYWISYSDIKNTNIDLNDTYFFGKANSFAEKFYNSFLEAVAKNDAMDEDRPGFDLDDLDDDDFESTFSHSSPTKH